MTVHFLRLLSALVLCGAFAAQAHAADFRQPRACLYTGGQPTAEALRTLSQQGVLTVIDLRPASEDRGFDEAAETGKLGLRYIHLPIANADDLTPPMPPPSARPCMEAMATCCCTAPLATACAPCWP